ncbi:chondroitin sulfate synthase 1-like [Gigantopelta aegis]|uniref:chondroitin sulfate synthase 1-like n=1 Tax=Gigantopelta aegis TaxID=1735272 RepID=UPI001B88918C|nr:chondroitin sulfate synthase 1-like [Gigantopelta aegis]XP_041375012.1 chondroitin sulfate synthase 1-like [Gigantopelta aegis]XP_041375013.1 chondroitin sulfate synthase 1-like [Gigantopelta aegis]
MCSLIIQNIKKKPFKNMKIHRKLCSCYCLCHFVCGFLLGAYLVNRLALLFFKRNVHSCFKPHPRQTNLFVKDIPLLNTNNESFILIGVMTTRQNLATRAAAISRTWGKLVPGKIIFFVGKGKKYNGNLPVVVLNEASDNIYPPQGKSFMMIKHIHDNYLDTFEWFIRADDDLFVKIKDLEVFLRSVNSSRRLYIGQPGLGIPTERGKLGLRDESSFYCLGGPGVVLSRETLRLVVLSMSTCRNSTFTAHEDTELGRCVHRRAGVSCTSAYEFIQLFYQNYNNKNGSFEGKLDHRLTHALTLHPVKNSEHVYRIHNHFSTQTVAQLTKKISHLERTLYNTNSELRALSVGADGERVNISTSENDGYEEPDEWNFIRSGLVFTRINPYQLPFENIRTRGRHLGFAISVLALGRMRSKQDMPVFSYQSVSVRTGLEHIHVMGNKNSLLRPYVTIRRFQSTEIAEVPTECNDRDRVIYMLLPLYQRPKTFGDFLKSLAVAISGYGGVIFLRVVIYRDSYNEYLLSHSYIKAFSNITKTLIIEAFPMVGQFSRAKALKRGLEGLSSDSLVVAMDVDMRFTADFLHRVSLNTELGKQVYFPIYITQYDPYIVCYGKPECRVNKTIFHFGHQYGTWRHFSYGIVGVYKGDVTKVGGFNILIEGWGKEDTDFLAKCIKYGLTVFRSIDSGLMHIHHTRVCDVNLPRDQFKMCLESRAAIYGSQFDLSNIVFNISDIK